jgi:hypothetical protein
MFYRELIRLVRETPALCRRNREDQEVLGYERSSVLYLRRWAGDNQAFVVFNFGDGPSEPALPVPAGHWYKAFDSTEWTPAGSGGKAVEDRSVPQGTQAGALPGVIESDGEVQTMVPGQSFVVFTIEGQELGT